VAPHSRLARERGVIGRALQAQHDHATGTVNSTGPTCSNNCLAAAWLNRNRAACLSDAVRERPIALSVGWLVNAGAESVWASVAALFGNQA
jgi:hypothetical protein